MSINFATLQGLTIPEGVVTQITDAAGNVLWALPVSGIVLDVEKFTSDTYAGETTYTGEQFILLDIYPKTNGTVTVTYGGLTKTVTDTSGAESPNAQQVFFGTFNGVSDSVTTPASGELVIDGDYSRFTCSAAQTGKYDKVVCDCIVRIKSFGRMVEIPSNAFSTIIYGSCTKIVGVNLSRITGIGTYAFYGCTGLTGVTIPASVTSIGACAFVRCSNLTDIKVDSNNEFYWSDGAILFNKDKTELVAYPSVSGHYTVPAGVTRIGDYSFHLCAGLTGITLPTGVTDIGYGAFQQCDGLTSVNLPASLTSIGNSAFRTCNSLTSVTIPASVTNIGNTAFVLESDYTRTVTMLSATPPALGGDGVFDAAGTNLLVVPAGSGATYKAAEYWSEYADYITEGS